VKLLFDQNLSPTLAQRLRDVFPHSTHVFHIGLDRSTDLDIWKLCHNEGFTIVSRDSDFSDLSMVLGFPPKVLWIRRANCSTQQIEEMLRTNLQAVLELADNPETGVLELY